MARTTFGKAWDIRLELGGALAPPLARAHGVRRDEVRAALAAARGVLPELQSRQAPSGFLRVLGRTSVVRDVVVCARRWRRRGLRDVVHVGIGGSALGAETLFRAATHPHHNLLPDRVRRGPRVHFVDNVDPDSLATLFDVVDLRHSLVHVVSKSGSTVETAAGFQVLRRALERAGRGVRWQDRCVFTSGRKGPLADLARSEGVERLDFPDDVGGRYSVLTASGLLTPALAGVDVSACVAGGRRMRTRCSRGPLVRNPAAAAAAVAWLLGERRGKPVHVLMAYSDALEPLARWWVQLCAESLGKQRGRAAHARGVGPTPLPARGTTDQHSQVQLYVQGPADKLVTFVVAERARALRLPGGPPAPYLERVELGELLRAEQRGTEVALAEAGRPTTAWVLPQVHPYTLGQLFVALEIQTAIQAALLGVNAYDQPGVEAGKVAAYALLGRKGYEDRREEIERGSPPRWTL